VPERGSGAPLRQMFWTGRTALR